MPRSWCSTCRAVADIARATGETAPFPYEDLRFGEPKRDDLSFIVMEKAL